MRKIGALAAGLLLAVVTLLGVASRPAAASYLAATPAAAHKHHPAKSHKGDRVRPTRSDHPTSPKHPTRPGHPQHPKKDKGDAVTALRSPGDRDNGRDPHGNHTTTPTGKEPTRATKTPTPATKTPTPATTKTTGPAATTPTPAPIPLLSFVPPSEPGQALLLASPAGPAAGAVEIGGGGTGGGTAGGTGAATGAHHGTTSAGSSPASGRRGYSKRPLADVGAPALSLKTVDHLSIPIVFGIGVALFILLQALVDRRDPKVSRAPQHGDDDSIGFK